MFQVKESVFVCAEVVAMLALVTCVERSLSGLTPN